MGREEGTGFRKVAYLCGKMTDRWGTSGAAATRRKRGGGLEASGGCFEWRDAAGRRSGRDSQPRFADAKGDVNSDRN